MAYEDRTTILQAEWDEWEARAAETEAWKDEKTWINPALPNCLGCNADVEEAAGPFGDTVIFRPCNCRLTIERPTAKIGTSAHESFQGFVESLRGQGLTVTGRFMTPPGSPLAAMFIPRQAAEGAARAEQKKSQFEAMYGGVKANYAERAGGYDAEAEATYGLHDFVDTPDEEATMDFCLLTGCGKPKPREKGGSVHRTRAWLERELEGQGVEHELKVAELKGELKFLERKHNEVNESLKRQNGRVAELTRSVSKLSENHGTVRVRLRQAIWGHAANVADEYENTELARMADNRIITLTRELDAARKAVEGANAALPQALELLEGPDGSPMTPEARDAVLKALRDAHTALNGPSDAGFSETE